MVQLFAFASLTAVSLVSLWLRPGICRLVALSLCSVTPASAQGLITAQGGTPSCITPAASRRDISLFATSAMSRACRAGTEASRRCEPAASPTPMPVSRRKPIPKPGRHQLLIGGFGSSDLVTEARRYIGGNPTGRGSLWCARFMNMVLQRSGHRGTGSDMASSFASYGQRISGPQVGAIAVMGRRGGGHVGIITGIDAQAIRS